MGPKVEAACAFTERPGSFAAIGTLQDASSMLHKTAGTIIDATFEGISTGSARRIGQSRRLIGHSDDQARPGFP